MSCRAKSPFDMDAYRPSCSNTCPIEFAMIVHDCIKSNPEKRPNAAEVCSRLNHALSTLCPLNSTRNPAAGTSANGNGNVAASLPANGVNNGQRNGPAMGSFMGSRHESAQGGAQGENTVQHRAGKTVATRPKKPSNMFLRCFGV